MLDDADVLIFFSPTPHRTAPTPHATRRRNRNTAAARERRNPTLLLELLRS